ANEVTGEHRVYFGQRLSGGGSHSAVITNDTLFMFGRNNVGQDGIGVTSVLGDANHPDVAVAVGLLAEGATTAATPVSAALGQNASIVLDSTGHVWGFGDNANGQLCLGDTTNRLRPTRVEGIDDVVAVHRGFSHTLLLKADGTVWACGLNTSGQLGDGTTTARSVPTPVVGLGDIVHINGGSQTSYAVDVDGAVWAWGRNQYGTLGNGLTDTAPHVTPTVVAGVRDVDSLGCGRDHVVALQTDGVVKAWGIATALRTDEDVTSPVVVADNVAGVVAVYANGLQSFVEDGAGQLFGWGQNGSGNLGIPSDAHQATPTTPVFGVTRALDVGIGALHGLALDADGFVYAWGWSFQGSLGGGNTVIATWPYRIPILVLFPEDG
ncbi:MAG TPA: chromosome condensation regulator RCC1, partial [Myxococcota bacterium]